MHAEACFVTLTYDDESLPHVAVPRGDFVDIQPTLRPRDLSLFWKRLRKHLGIKVRYFACGEYGDELRRPHYHFILYGYSFPDKVLAPDQNGSLDPLYISAQLSTIWKLGYHTIGSVTQKSIEYVARYTLKRKSGRTRRFDKDPRTPIFGTQSRNPGIGATWILKWRNDVYPSDSVVIDGQEHRPPRYYDNLIARDHPELVEGLKAQRRKRGEQRERDGFFSHQEMQAKKSIYESQLRFKRRNRCG